MPPMIKPAPPREALKVFGGWMSIEQFRGCRKTYTLIPQNVLMQPPVVEEVPAHRRPRSTKTLTDEVSYTDVMTQNEMVRSSGLKRKKPLAKHNLLVKTLGVQILS